MRCGCIATETDKFYSVVVNSESCLLPKTVIMIRELVLASAWHGSALNQQAEKLLEEIDDINRKDPGDPGAISLGPDNPAA
jgi:hypothetical protein